MPPDKLESLKTTPSSLPAVRILALCDSPLVTTGFARVARNILGRWCQYHSPESSVHVKDTVSVKCWAIHFDGWEYERSPFQLFPGGSGDWNSAQKLSHFLGELDQGGYTHVWILMDPDALNVGRFPEQFRRICKERGIRSMLYFPVDAPLEVEWLAMVTAVDVPVAYTEYGRAEARRALGKSQWPIEVVPHGIDEIFKPISVEDRARFRNIELSLPAPVSERNKDGKKMQAHQFLQPSDFLILNVNKNEWRKDPLRSLEILKGLRESGVPAKLILRMQGYSTMGGVGLELAAEQLGLTYGKEWCRLDELSDEHLCGLYNAADLYLTTSMGEGWGLGVTEAMACHCPVAMACHTSLKEIGEQVLGQVLGSQETSNPELRTSNLERKALVIWLPMEEGFVCGADTRLRRRVDLKGAVETIKAEVSRQKAEGGRIAPKADLKEFTWDAAAERMWHLLVESKP
jgi:glycosyltransferase involved in cell wall biosynthesis